MKNPMLKFIMKEKKGNVVHTSVYAEAQNSGKFGASSTRSFSDRMRIKGNRQRIREYNDSRIVTEAYASSGIRAKTYEAPKTQDAFLNKNEKTTSVAPTKQTSKNTNSSEKSSTVRNPGVSKKI